MISLKRSSEEKGYHAFFGRAETRQQQKENEFAVFNPLTDHFAHPSWNTIRSYQEIGTPQDVPTLNTLSSSCQNLFAVFKGRPCCIKFDSIYLTKRVEYDHVNEKIVGPP
jgi:hypothetical protein